MEPGDDVATRDFVIVRLPDGMSARLGVSDRARSVLACGDGIEVVPNERLVLNNFLTRLLRHDPDDINEHDVM